MTTPEEIEVADTLLVRALVQSSPKKRNEIIATALSEAEARGRAKALEEAKQAIREKAHAMDRKECCGIGVQSGPESPPECCGDPLYMISDEEAADAIRALQDKAR